MLGKVKETVQKFGMIRPGETVVAAVSGGPDSVALLSVLNDLAPEMGLKLIVAHVNHALRAEADMEEGFVRRLAGELGWPCESERIDVDALRRKSKTSLEDAARSARYDFLRETARRLGASKIALGHHSGDQAETVLINLIRGAGNDGLKGIVPVRDGLYIRPLLFISRDEILDDLKKRGMTFVHDASNDSDDFLRNRIRRKLLPTLRESFNPKIEESLCRLAEIVSQEDDFMESLAAKFLSNWNIGISREPAVLSVPEVLKLHDALQNRIIKRILEGFCPEGKGIAFTHVMAVKKLIHGSQPNASLDLPQSLLVRREYDRVIVELVSADKKQFPDFAYSVDIPGEVAILETGMRIRFSLHEAVPDLGREGFKNPAVAWMDYDRISPPLIVRNFRAGDRMHGMGMTSSKKIKDIFIDDKIPRAERRRLPLLVDGLDVLWIGGRRLSERVRINDLTRRIVKAEII